MEAMSTAVPVQLQRQRAPKPEWLKVRAPGSPAYLRLKDLMREQGLHTVCEEAPTSANAGTMEPPRS
jgi:lipoic acid synthetase